MNNENLIPTTSLTESERRELARRAGIASGKARREKRKMQEVMEAALNLPLKDEVLGELKSIADSKSTNVTAVEAVCLSMIRAAIKGNVKAALFVKETAEEVTERDARNDLDDLIKAIEGAANEPD